MEEKEALTSTGRLPAGNRAGLVKTKARIGFRKQTGSQIISKIDERKRT